jgi:hypothetical protein
MSELVTDYLERRLPLRPRIGVRWHLSCCGACRAYFRQMQSLVGLLGRLPGEPPGDATEARLMARFGQAEGN